MAATLDRWKGVPAFLLRKIIALVPCEADRRSTARVCRLWGAALAKRPGEAPLPLAPQLPWLLLQLPGGPAFSCVHRGDGSSGFHRVRIPGVRGAGAGDARYFGSYDGRWLFVTTRGKIDEQEHCHVILNLRNGNRFSVPHEFSAEMPFRPLRQGGSRGILMLVATLSAAPNEDRCVGAAIVRCAPFDSRSRRQITFWSMGDQLAMAPHDAMFGEPEDVVYYKREREFHFLIPGEAGEQVLVCTPVFDRHGVLQAVSKGIRIVQPHEFHADEQQPRVRYLVESRGELLMVIKSPAAHRWRFMVFKMTRVPTTDPGYMLYRWVMLPGLDGRILFVGKGCSRSFEVLDFPGFHTGVYFLDDLDKSNLDISRENMQFPCHENGFWFWWRLLPKIERCFRPPDQDMTASSPPLWLLP